MTKIRNAMAMAMSKYNLNGIVVYLVAKGLGIFGFHVPAAFPKLFVFPLRSKRQKGFSLASGLNPKS